MYYDVVAAAALKDYVLYLKFADGTEGPADISDLIARGGVFAPLKDSALFRQVRLEPGWRTVNWPNGADVAPESLYQRVKKKCSSLPH